MDLSHTGQFGDTVGGIANVATFFLVLWATKNFLPRELKKARHENVLGAHAAAASRIWLSTFVFTTHLKGLTDAAWMGAGTFEEMQGRRMQALAPAADEFITLMGLARLHFDETVLNAMEALWKARAKLLTDIAVQSRSGDSETYARIYGGETKKKIDELEAEVLRLLRPFALPE